MSRAGGQGNRTINLCLNSYIYKINHQNQCVINLLKDKTFFNKESKINIHLLNKN